MGGVTSCAFLMVVFKFGPALASVAASSGARQWVLRLNGICSAGNVSQAHTRTAHATVSCSLVVVGANHVLNSVTTVGRPARLLQGRTGKNTGTQKHTHRHKHAHTHAHTTHKTPQTHRHTETHRHSSTTHTDTHAHTDTHRHRCTDTIQTHTTHTQTHRQGAKAKEGTERTGTAATRQACTYTRSSFSAAARCCMQPNCEHSSRKDRAFLHRMTARRGAVEKRGT